MFSVIVIEINRIIENRQENRRRLYVKDKKVNKSDIKRSKKILYNVFSIRRITRLNETIRQSIKY